jgi:hypothetical protein
MRIRRKRLTWAAISLALTLAFTLAAWSGSANQNANPQETQKQEITPEKDIPVLDLKLAEATGSDQLKGRKRRNSLRQDKKIAELPPEVEPLPFSAHTFARLPALPVEQSDVIILGKVTDRRAVLANDRLGIYSEFSITVTEIFKDDLNLFFVGEVITASRPGGAVRFSSGRIQQYTVSNQGYPQQDKVYVLFLKRDEDGDFAIQTGYEVVENVVQPLDGKRKLPKNERDLKFGIYRGVSLESFRDSLQKALQQGGGEGRN